MQVSPDASFKAQKQPFIFQMSLRDCQKEPTVTIELTHCISKQKYALQVNQSTIEKLKGLSKFFETPIQLYSQLIQIFQNINIDNDGAITFQVNIGKTKKRTVMLKTQKKPVQIIETSEFANLKEDLFSLKKQLMSEISQLKLQQQINMKQLIELQTINQLKALVLSQNRQIDVLNLELQTMKLRLNEKINQNSQLGEAVSALSFEVKELKTAHQTTRLKLQQLQQEMYDDQCEEQEQKFQQIPIVGLSKQEKQQIKIKLERIIMNSFDEHPQHSNPFMITKLNHNRYRVQKSIINTFWEAFIPDFKILPRKKAAIRMRVTQTQKMQIMLGFCSAKLFGSRNLWKFDQAAALDFRSGSVWCDGQLFHQGTQMIQSKRVVQLEVDLFNGTFSWRYLDNNNYTNIRNYKGLDKSICNQELYFYVLMCKNQDQVDIITD